MEELQKKAPTTITLPGLCKETALANLRYIGDVGEMDISLLEDILPHCNIDQLTRIENLTKGRDLSSVTDKLWKRFYEQTFGVDSANTAMQQMEDCGVVVLWRKLYEAKVQSTEEITRRLAQKLKRRYQEIEASYSNTEKESRKIQFFSQIPPSRKRMSSWGGTNVSNFKSNLMKKAKIDCVTSHEVWMRKRSLQQNSTIHKRVPHPTNRFQL